MVGIAYLFITQGRIQFFIEAIDSGLPNIIDSLLIDLDNLQLGADFTEEMTFNGFHNISHMTMSFRVMCSPGFCGPVCLTTSQNNPQVAECRADGSITCINDRLDPEASCNSCLDSNFNMDTNCETCAKPNFNKNENCMSCLLGYDMAKNCTQCLPNRDPSTNCSSCSLYQLPVSTQQRPLYQLHPVSTRQGHHLELY